MQNATHAVINKTAVALLNNKNFAIDIKFQPLTKV